MKSTVEMKTCSLFSHYNLKKINTQLNPDLPQSLGTAAVNRGFDCSHNLIMYAKTSCEGNGTVNENYTVQVHRRLANSVPAAEEPEHPYSLHH